MYWITYSPYLMKVLDSINSASAQALATSTLDVWRRGRTVFACGNGGSASNANHLAQDLCKATIVPGAPRLCAISLCDNVSAITAWANDEGYEHIYAQQLETLGQSGDLLIAISGSGNSPNILEAVRAAHDLEIRTWGITGYDGGKLRHLANRSVHVETPCSETGMGMAEAAHGVLFHWLADYLRPAIAAEHEGRLSIMDSGAWCPGAER